MVHKLAPTFSCKCPWTLLHMPSDIHSGSPGSTKSLPLATQFPQLLLGDHFVVQGMWSLPTTSEALGRGRAGEQGAAHILHQEDQGTAKGGVGGRVIFEEFEEVRGSRCATSR